MRRSDEVRFMHESEGEELTEAGGIFRAGDAFRLESDLTRSAA